MSWNTTRDLFPSSVFAAVRVLLYVRVVCLRSVFAARASSSMKRGKKAEEAAVDEDNDSGSGQYST